MILFLSGKYLQTQWVKLRDNYRKCLKRREKATRSGAGVKTLPTCAFISELTFISDSVSNRATESNIDPGLFTPPPSPDIVVPRRIVKSPSMSQTAQHGLFTPPPSPDIVVPRRIVKSPSMSQTAQQSSSQSSSVTTIPKSTTPLDSVRMPVKETCHQKGNASKEISNKRKNNHVDDLLAQAIMDDMNEKKRKETLKDNTLDHDELFCQSLVPYFNGLSKYKGKLARIKVLQVLCDIDESD